jgi:hypothetical protein
LKPSRANSLQKNRHVFHDFIVVAPLKLSRPDALDYNGFCVSEGQHVAGQRSP